MMGRALGAGRALASVHLELAQKEAAEDAGRIGVGVGLLAAAIGLLGFAGLLGHLAALLWARARFGLGWEEAALALGAVDVVLAVLLLLLARGRLNKPVLERTRGRVKETVAALRGD